MIDDLKYYLNELEDITKRIDKLPRNADNHEEYIKLRYAKSDIIDEMRKLLNRIEVI